MANGEPQVGGSPLDGGGSPEAGKAVGQINVNSRASIDSSAFKELNKEFKALNAHVTKFKQDLPKLIEDTKKWATELGKVAKQLKAVGEGQGVDGGSYIPAAGSGTNIGSGNVTNVTQVANVYQTPAGAGGGGGGGRTPSVGGGKAGAYLDMAGQLMGALDSRIARGAEYSLSADRMNMLYQQMYGGTQNETYHRFRAPLQGYKLGMGGINELLQLQATTGLNAQRQAGSIEAMRAATGYAYSTSQIAGMTAALATPEASNQMFMMLGTGMYGIGGKQRTQQEVYRDIIQRTGLTNEKMVQSAFQQGSMTRYRLAAAGVPEDQIDLLLQTAQQNITFKKKGGQGFYDPSKKEHREMMGVESNYATQAEETERVRAVREENFYKRQADNFATFEKGLQNVTKALQAFEEKLSGIVGARVSTKSITSTLGKIGGFALTAAGIATGNPGLAFAGTALSTLGGDATPKSSRRSSVKKAGAGSGEGGGLSANNERKLKQLDPKLAVPLRRMLEDNPKLRINEGIRSKATQEQGFKARYKPRPDLKEKTKDADRIWNGVVWEHVAGPGVPAMAPPGSSWHEHGMAADVFGDDAWIIANASKYGLGHGGTGTGGPEDEPFHIQPASTMAKLPDGSGSRSVSVTETATVSAEKETDGSGSRSGSNVTISKPSSSASAGSSPIEFSYSDMSMGEVVGTGSVYAGTGGSTAQGGDSVPMGRKTASTGAYNITVSPTFTIHASGVGNMDWQKMTKEVASLLEKEVRLTMMRSS